MSTASVWPRPVRSGVTLALATLAGLWVWSLCLDAARTLDVDMGPGARDYLQGLSPTWVFDGEMSWRSLQTRARVTLPLTVEGPGTLVLTLRSKGPSPSEIRAELDDASLGTLSLAPDSGPGELRWEIPDGRRRASVRLRSEAGSGSVVEIARLRWQVATIAPSRHIALALGALVALTYLALVIAGLGPGATLAGTFGVALAMSAISLVDGFAGLHLAPRLASAALLGTVGLVLVRLLAPSSSALLRALFLSGSSSLRHSRSASPVAASIGAIWRGSRERALFGRARTPRLQSGYRPRASRSRHDRSRGTAEHGCEPLRAG